MNYDIPTHDPEDPHAWDPQRVAAYFTQEPRDLALAAMKSERELTHARLMYDPEGEDWADLKSAGYLAVVEAAHKVDPTRSAPEIVTYMYTRAVWALRDELRRMEDVYRENYEYHTPPDPEGLNEPVNRAAGEPRRKDPASYTFEEILPGTLGDTEDDILRRIDMVYAVERIRGER